MYSRDTGRGNSREGGGLEFDVVGGGEVARLRDGELRWGRGVSD